MSTGEAPRSWNAFRCLVADDSEFARGNIGRVIEKLGGTVVAQAGSGREAVALFERLRPELVLLDITMPELDGVEALRQIRALDGSARVIMVSSLGHKAMVWSAIRLGARHFITKPFTPDYASLVIRSVLAGEVGGGP
jgi:two-component system chemotaxis response regulator CheY